MKTKLRGLKFLNWLYMMSFSILILVVLWVLQFLFLGTFYHSMKLSETKSVGNKIADKFAESDYRSIMAEYAFNNNLRIIVIDEYGRMIGTFDGFMSSDPGIVTSAGAMPRNALVTAIRQLNESQTDRIAYLNDNGQGNRNEITQAIYAAIVYDSYGSMYYLYISNPIPAIDSTTSVLKTQFYIIIAILFVLSFAVSLVISRKLSAPIIKLTKSADKLIKGELDTEVSDNGYTEINRLAAAMNYAAEELRSLDKYRKEFIANVSHDLKTPLTIIKFYGEMIRDVSGDNPDKRIDHCETIIKEADWLTGMVGEILELSKLESGNAAVTKAYFDLSRCLRDTLASFNVLSETGGYTFRAEIEENLCVFGNEQMLKRVLYNLVSNAVNFTGEDKLVSVSLKEESGAVRFAVTDTGAGLSEEQQKVIWERYYKSSEAHKRPVVGTGIGLSIVKNVLSLHEAEFGVISEPGSGSTFWFVLPIADYS